MDKKSTTTSKNAKKESESGNMLGFKKSSTVSKTNSTTRGDKSEGVHEDIPTPRCKGSKTILEPNMGTERT